MGEIEDLCVSWALGEIEAALGLGTAGTLGVVAGGNWGFSVIGMSVGGVDGALVIEGGALGGR